MNKSLTTEEIAEAVGVCLVDRPMTRKEKLSRLADLIRQSNGDFVIFHRLETYDNYELSRISHPYSAFAMAANDPVFQKAGLKNDDVLSSMQFFELSRNELHEFSCDCGGAITNKDMASRIDYLNF